MKRFLALALVGGLVFGSFASAEAAKKKKKKPKPPAAVSVEQKMYLRGNSCTGDNRDWLSVTDADEEVECFYTRSGIIYEATTTAGAQKREEATREWEAQDGVPFTLDATKPITGEITTAGFSCVVTIAPCSPAGIGIGEMVLEITIVGTIGGADKELGAMKETFTVLPGQMHTTKLDFKLDGSLNGASLEGIKLLTFQHGRSFGHGVIKTNNPNSSFITIPTLVTQ